MTMISLDRQHALSAASQAFQNRGIDIACPWDGDLDDLERERFDAMVAAIDAYNELTPPPSGEAGEVTDEMVERAARAEYTRVILPSVMPEFHERELNANWRFYEEEARRWLSGALPTIKEPTDGK